MSERYAKVIKQVPTYTVTIFIAGHHELALEEAQRFCDEVGLCVTVTPTTFVYTGGREAGVIVGLINYARFPSDPDSLWLRATILARRLVNALDQQSCTIMDSENSLWESYREAE